MNVKNKLLNFKNKVIYQNDEWFMFSIDSVLLANFVNLKSNISTVFDLATGNAPVAMLLTYRTNAKIIGIELQKEIYTLGLRSVNENGFNSQILLYNMDIKEVNKVFESECADVVVCNPPFFKTTEIKNMNKVDIKSIARHEIKLNLDSLLKNAKFLLKNKGVFAMVHRSERLVEIISVMKKYNIEPKRIQFVYSNTRKNSSIILIEGIKNGNSGIKILPPFFVHNDDGSYTSCVKNMFGE